MSETNSQRIELTPEMLDFARGAAIKEAGKYCSDSVDFDDVIQEVYLNLLRRPPRPDPNGKAKDRTVVYAAVRHIVMKYAEREARYAKRHPQLPKPERKPSKDKPERPMERQKREYVELRPRDLTWKGLTADDILRYIDDPASRHLCETVLLSGGNLSEAARRLRMPESTVRHRLKVLGPKLLATGFNPLRQESYVFDD